MGAQLRGRGHERFRLRADSQTLPDKLVPYQPRELEDWFVGRRVRQLRQVLEHLQEVVPTLLFVDLLRLVVESEESDSTSFELGVAHHASDLGRDYGPQVHTLLAR